jgi:DNA-binding MarR family transcriptional regulator
MSDWRTSYLVGRAGRILGEHLDEALAEVGLTLAEYTALSVLRARPGLSNARLARRALVTPQAMHKVVRALEGRGLVARSDANSGGRAREAFVTPAGKRLLAKVAPRIDAAEDAFFAPLGERDRADFERMLVTVSGMDTASAPSGW